MWHVEAIEAIPVTLDFTSSGQGRRTATAITAAGLRLFNAIELVDVDAVATQVEVCEHCGYTQCSPGGWVAFRRMGDSVAWIPAWDRMEEGEWERNEYQPPDFVRARGAPLFRPAAWRQLQSIHRDIPPCGDLPMLNSREAARLCQWSAPGKVLGRYPEKPQLDRQALLAVTSGELADEANAVDMCLDAHFGCLQPMTVMPGDMAVEPIEFWLDLPGSPGWTSFGHADGRICLLFGGEPALIASKG
jgi:hypothetical protein